MLESYSHLIGHFRNPCLSIGRSSFRNKNFFWQGSSLPILLLGGFLQSIHPGPAIAWPQWQCGVKSCIALMTSCLYCGGWFYSTFSVLAGKYIVWFSLSMLKSIWENLFSLPLFGKAQPALHSSFSGTYDFKCLIRGCTGAENLQFFSFFL